MPQAAASAKHFPAPTCPRHDAQRCARRFNIYVVDTYREKKNRKIKNDEILLGAVKNVRLLYLLLHASLHGCALPLQCSHLPTKASLYDRHRAMFQIFSYVSSLSFSQHKQQQIKKMHAHVHAPNYSSTSAPRKSIISSRHTSRHRVHAPELADPPRAASSCVATVARFLDF
jgi:hypothetical protein